jgi:hypothetical protein
MTGQGWWIGSIAAILLAASGCTTCGYQNYRLAREAGPDCELPSCQREGVYVFAISSLNPVSIVALDSLREELNRHGFSKVSTGQTIHAWWMAREMRRIRDAEPNAQFVIVGFESAGSSAMSLARKASATGISVNGVVVINSEGSFPESINGVRVLAVGKVENANAINGVEPVPVQNVASYGLATDARTLEAIGHLLNDVATGVPVPVVEEATEWDYRYAPPMRAVGDPSRVPEWAFLFDNDFRVVIPATTPTLPTTPAATPSPAVAVKVQPALPALRSAIR